MSATVAAAAGLTGKKDDKSDGTVPKCLACGRLSVTPNKLIPLKVIKSIPITDRLFNQLTSGGPDLAVLGN